MPHTPHVLNFRLPKWDCYIYNMVRQKQNRTRFPKRCEVCAYRDQKLFHFDKRDWLCVHQHKLTNFSFLTSRVTLILIIRWTCPHIFQFVCIAVNGYCNSFEWFITLYSYNHWALNHIYIQKIHITYTLYDTISSFKWKIARIFLFCKHKHTHAYTLNVCRRSFFLICYRSSYHNQLNV